MSRGSFDGGAQVISNQILQSTLEGIKNISRVDLSVMDTEGILLASTFDGASAEFCDISG